MRTNLQYRWQRFTSIAAALVGAVTVAFALSGCGGSDSVSTSTTDPTVPTVAAPGAPTNLTVIRTPEVTLSATVSWSPPTSGGAPVSYEIYRSTTAGTAFSPDNHVISVPVVAGQATYTFIDNAGLTPVDTYWAVSAKNAGGETPTAEVMYKPIGPPSGTGDTGFGNNFAAALIFADDIGIGGLDIAGVWTTDATLIDYNTGLRPALGEIADLAALTVPVIVTTLPYLDPATVFLKNNLTFYKQQTDSIWQGQWEKGKLTPQQVNAKWGDNLISQRLTANSVIRIEMVLSKAPDVAMTSYTMQTLYGARENEVYGTDGTTYAATSAFVFASNARLKIQKLDALGNPDGAPLYNQTLWSGDGPGFLAGEVNVAGNFTYGFVWKLNTQVLPPDILTGKTGTWRLTFALDPDNSTAGKAVTLAPNNTFMTTAANGVRVSDTEVYIDIVVQ